MFHTFFDRHGEGKCVYPAIALYGDRKSFEGIWQEDHFRHGKLTHRDGRVYTGDFNRLNVDRNGKGVCVYPDGRTCYGEWKNNKAVHGKYDYGDGKVYTGDFKDGHRHGKGKCVYPTNHPNFRSVIGTWENDDAKEGFCVFRSGNKYNGQWGKTPGKEGGNQRHGQGVCYYYRRVSK